MLVPVTASDRAGFGFLTCTCGSARRCEKATWVNMANFWLDNLPSGAGIDFLCSTKLTFNVTPNLRNHQNMEVVQVARPWLVTNSTQYMITVEDFGNSTEVVVYGYGYSETLGKVHIFATTLTRDNPTMVVTGQSSAATMARMFGATANGTRNVILSITD